MKNVKPKIPFSLIVKEAGFKTKYFWLTSLLYLLFGVGCLIYLVSCDIQPLIQFLDEHNSLAGCFFGYLLFMFGFICDFSDICDSLSSAASRLRKARN